MNRNEKNTEKIKMFANSLVQKCADNGIKAVAVVSSELDCGYLSSLMEKVKAFLAEKGEKLTPLKNSFVLAPNWSHFPMQDCSWLRNGAIFRLWHQN